MNTYSEDVTPTNLPGTLLLLDYGKNPLYPRHTPERSEQTLNQ